MIKIKTSPVNKQKFIKLKKFAQEILQICESLKITPILWGGLAYFGYTKNKKYVIDDVDLLVPEDSIKKIIAVLKNKKIKYKFLSKWKSLIISKGNLRIEIDTIEMYQKTANKFNTFDFDGFITKVVSLDNLIKSYRIASEISRDKPEQHKNRFEELRRLKK